MTATAPPRAGSGPAAAASSPPSRWAARTGCRSTTTPTAKPTYDFYDTVNAGKTAVANGVLESVTRHVPDAAFPGGSATSHSHSRAPVASSLVENSVCNYSLTSRIASDGIGYYQAQDTSISAAQQQDNLAIMNQQPDI